MNHESTPNIPPALGLDKIACLSDPIRRSIFLLIEQGKKGTSRRQIASRLRISLELARFHLDRLEAAGLVASTRERLGDRSGRGGGRPSKVYSLAGAVGVSIPPRRYDLVGKILLRAFGRRESRSSGDIDQSAYDVGREQSKPGVSLTETLEALGFEPFEDEGGVIRFGNCPFHELVQEDRQTVCGMNLSFARGLLAGTGDANVVPVLDPAPDRCCVAFVSA